MVSRRSAVLYAALALGAIFAVANLDAIKGAMGVQTAPDVPVAETTGISGAHPLAEGLMKKLAFHRTARPASTKIFTDPAGSEHSLAEYRGKYVLVNMWATWCAPCRKEMPSLDRLQKTLGGDDFAVVTIATGRNTLPGIRKFFEEAEVTSLPILLDPKQTLARDMGVLGLPVSVILDVDGNEIARLRGDAEWDSKSALAIIGALIGAGG